MAAKRKSSKAGPSRLPANEEKRTKLSRHLDTGSGDDFDDDQNLLAAAAYGNGSDASEMMSDEDMEGGFEDLEVEGSQHDGNYDYEDEDADEDAFEVLDSGEEEGGAPRQAPRIGEYAEASSSRSKKALYALPTNEEMQGLRETGELFKTNILKLQIEEMLSSVRPKYHKAAPLETVLRRLHQLLQSIEPIAPVSVQEAPKAIKKAYPSAPVSIPFCDPAPKRDANYKLAFEKPSGIQLVGSWPLRAAAERPQGLDVDVALVMPSALFQEKDHLNFRYFHKRSFYLAVLAAAISSSAEKLGVTLTYAYDAEDSKKPMLVLHPIPDKSESDFRKLKAVIRLHLACDTDIFPLGRLAPSRNNIRQSELSEQGGTAHPATPRYNGDILADSLRSAHLLYLHNTMKTCPAFADACALLRVWSFQRGFGSGSAKSKSTASPRRMAMGSNNVRFLLTMVLAHLLHGEERSARRTSARAKLASGFSSYQLFRGVIDWLATHNFAQEPVFMKSSSADGLSSRADKISRDDFTQQFSRVLVDPSGSINLFANWLPGSVDLLQHEAKLTFALLDDAETDHFEELFLCSRYHPMFTFDDVAHLKLKAAERTPFAQLERGNGTRAMAAALSQTLVQALQSRCRFSTVFGPAEDSTWTIEAPARHLSRESEIGFMYDAAQALRLVEHGPTPEDTPAADEFQEFWGDVAELRRFKDGRILWSIVWEIAKQSERWGIPRRIIRHALARHHAEVDTDRMLFSGESFANLLEVPQSIAENSYLASPEEKGFQLVQSAFDSLAKQFRAMEELPLSLINVQAGSAGLRSMSTFIPPAVDVGTLGSSTTPDCASHLPAQELVLTFESSGRWPDELKSIQAMKLAFLHRLATVVADKIPGSYTSVALDADAAKSPILDKASLELVLPSGFAFRARIHHERERTLLERIVADKRHETPSMRDEASRALDRLNLRYRYRPAHHAAMSSLASRYAGLSDTVRLLKRWVRAHMLDGSGHVSDEALELLAVSVFVSPGSTTPATGSAGFSQVLKKLSMWNWKEEPLLIPVDSAVSAFEQLQRSTDGHANTKSPIRFATEGRLEATEAFKQARSSDPSLSKRAWFLATESDVNSEWFTSSGPTGATAHALQNLASSAVRLLEASGNLGEATERNTVVRSLFRPGKAAFDFVLQLDPSVLPRYAPHFLEADPAVWLGPGHATDKKKAFRNATPSSSTSHKSKFGPTPRPDFDPASSFVRLLRSLYSDSFRLYHDPHGSPMIGGIFNPMLASQSRRFKVAAGFNAEPATQGGDDSKATAREQVRLNTAAVLAEVERLGEGLVTGVEVRQRTE